MCKPQTILLINTFNDTTAVEFVSQERKLTLINAICGTPLRTLEKANQIETASKLIFLIKRLNNLLNVGQKLNDLQIATLASDLLDFCQNETLEDMVILFKMARKGELGTKIYRLDSMVILQEWMPVYLDLKYQEKERELQRKKSELAAAEMEASKEVWESEYSKKWRQMQVALITENKPTKPPKEDYLQNSDSFKKVLALELKKMSLKQLKKLKKIYALRLSHAPYLSIVKDEIKTRVKLPLKSN
mgnify:CR=1 FL=1